MSIARHHAEWLSLVPVSGPFLSLPVLMDAFNTGLEPHDPDQSRLLRQEYGNWLESLEKRKADCLVESSYFKVVERCPAKRPTGYNDQRTIDPSRSLSVRGTE